MSSRQQELIRQQVASLREILLALPPDQRRSLNNLWSVLRNEILSLEAERDSIVRELAEHRRIIANQSGRVVIDPPTRPPSSASVLAHRTAGADSLEDLAQTVPHPEHITRLLSLPPAWVNARLSATRTRTNDKGCWLSNHAASSKSYTKDNLRNTRHPTDGSFIGLNVYRHQMAIVAGGRGQQLPMTCPPTSTHEVSHLCHNGGCFNPDHVRVEPKALNAARNECRHRFIITAADGTDIHPCDHWTWNRENREKCILKRSALPYGYQGKWIENRGDELYFRDGRSV